MMNEKGGMIGGFIDLVTTLKNLNISANAINQTLARVFPQTAGTSNTATAGSQTLPAQPAGFLVVTNPVTGTTVKVPYYNP